MICHQGEKQISTPLDKSSFFPYYKTACGEAYLGDTLILIKNLPDSSVDLIVTSPPFGLRRKKEYGNVDAKNYVQWFLPFSREFHRVLKKNGSLVIDIGGSWNPGSPTKSLYNFELPIALCKEIGFFLAQDFFWFNPAKLPTPAEWVTVRRIRVKDSINTVWWFSKTQFPKADNKRVLKPYSQSMIDLLKKGYKPRLRPSGHDISSKFSNNNGGAIPPNLISIANTESNGSYLKACRRNALKPHPARFPRELPEFFIKFLTVENDLVLDPFAGSNVTGEACEVLKRKWIAFELSEEYLFCSKFRFPVGADRVKKIKSQKSPQKLEQVYMFQESLLQAL